MSKTSKSNQIEKIVFGGNGITRIDGFVTFVPFSAPGDEVTLRITQKKKSFQIATIEKLIKSGPDRVASKCPHYTKCGGCQLQHLSYEGQLKAKQNFVQEALCIDEVPITPSPLKWNYRSHIRLNLAPENGGFKMGYIEYDNTTLIEPSICPIFSEDSAFFADLKKELLTLPNKGVKSASLRIFKNKEQVILAFSTFPRLPKKLIPFSFAEGVSYKSPGKERHLGKISFSPYGFMQNNLPVVEIMYQTIFDWAGQGPKKILDLYCGTGNTSILLEKMGHEVIGVEANSALLPSSNGVRFIHSTVEKALPKLLKTFYPDLIIVNPPRTGLSKEVLPYLKAKEILYLSCMPSTLARDVERLSPRYLLDKVQAFDMFPQTTHIETLVKLKAPIIPKQKKPQADDSSRFIKFF